MPIRTHQTGPRSGDEKLRQMASLRVFAGLSLRDLRTAGRLFDSSVVPAGVTFEEEGRHARWLHLLLEGSALASVGGRAHHVLRAGQCWGHEELFEGCAHPHSTMALSRVLLLSLDRRAFATLALTLPGTADSLRRAMHRPPFEPEWSLPEVPEVPEVPEIEATPVAVR